MKSNITTVLALLLKELKIQHATENLKRSILSHPDYPSLQGITGVLDEYKVNNVAFRATIDQLKEVECPTLLYLKERNGTFGLLHSINSQEAVLTTEISKKKSYPIHLFEELWSGIAVLAEPNEQSGEPLTSNEAKSSIPKIAYGAIVACLVLLLGLTGYQNSSIFFIALLMAKLIGIGFVALLASHELGIETGLTDKLCTLTKSTGCNEVLKSKASSIFGIVKLADVGLVYFTSTTLALIVSGIRGMAADMEQVLSWLSIYTLPFILFSVTYQLAVVKKWCPFCMGVAATLTAEAVLAFAIGNLQVAFPSHTSITLTVFCALITSSIWMVLKPVLKEKKRLERFEFLYTRLKRKPEVIKGLLS